MSYEGSTIYRPPSEADALIVQATVGCSWNFCTYCAMYRDRRFRVRPLGQTLDAIAGAGARFGAEVRKVFVADGDALVMEPADWEAILQACRSSFPRLRRVSAYAMARNILDKSPAELGRLRELGLSLLYIGPESGDDRVLRRIVKGGSFAEHAAAAARARAAGMKLSVIFLLGAGGRDLSADHARASARLATAMDPEYLSALTLTVVPGTPLARLEESGRFTLPDRHGLLAELRTLVAEASPREAIFRTNHASNYLPLEGRLPRDRDRLLAVLDAALAGDIALRPEWSRGL